MSWLSGSLRSVRNNQPYVVRSTRLVQSRCESVASRGLALARVVTNASAMRLQQLVNSKMRLGNKQKVLIEEVSMMPAGVYNMAGRTCMNRFVPVETKGYPALIPTLKLKPKRLKRVFAPRSFVPEQNHSHVCEGNGSSRAIRNSTCHTSSAS